ncbi:PAS domain S-box protein [Robertmurraya yapensis]|uniref:PAS domain S-box protein n=1 Tax=Bacillus yapensis TaxID=2492960 RepID=A0A3S0K5H8_9BACI|nr:sigma 54-interacting transcriptional regulator [Bacillus yapensis]RTR36021.1 PAS domain S-box protein [Bacillus yapensis]TKT05524.1 PAS domain S-box protein [Bacillus yapensis]
MNEGNNELIFGKVLDSIDAGVHVIDSEGNTIFYNKKMSEIEGMKIEDVLHKNIREIFSFHKNGQSTLLLVLNQRSEILNVRQSYFNNKQQEITTINNTFPIEKDGILIGSMEIARDVTKIEKMIQDTIFHKGDAKYTFESIIGVSTAITEVIEASKRAMRTNSSILIIGETGTGKELFAQSIHNGSSRSTKPFISQNCAAIPETLMEGILFGTKKGAFTGAIERPGLFEQADGGTLLLDEINSLDPSLQAKLLRVIQERTVRRVGDTKDRPVDVRIVATVNQDPIDLITNGLLRKDLFYRLSVVSLFIPPLRERKDDIDELVPFFIEKYNHLFGMKVFGIDRSLMESFLEYDWPGNVRELEHVIEGAMNLIDLEEIITFSHLPNHIRNKPQFSRSAEMNNGDKQIQAEKPLDLYLQDAEISYLKRTLQQQNGNITKTAQTLGMSRQNLQYRLRKYGISGK